MNGFSLAVPSVMPICPEPNAGKCGISLEGSSHTPLSIVPSLAVNNARSHAPFSAEVFA